VSGSRRGTARTLVAGAVVAGALLVPGAAQALTAAGVSTGKATAVGFDSATLTGAVNPKGSETFYYFQYGPTSALGLQTGILGAGAGTHTVAVAVPISGLAPLTLYHYRLVAVNGAGPAIGAQRTFVTTRVPLSLQILASPDPVPFGGAVTIQGTLSGTGNGNREVVLQGNAFPYTAGFANVGNPELTTAAGGFSFNVLGLTLSTQYRVVTTTNPPVFSPVTGEAVSVRVGAHARRLRARIVHGRRLVRFFGAVAPAMNGAHIAIMRLVHGHNVLVAGGALRPLNATSSRFNRIVRVRRGIYRIFVQVTGGALVSTFSAPMFVR
jgi:hypothetical protein